MISNFAMRANPVRAHVIRTAALAGASALALTFASGAAAQYRYLILDAPVDQPRQLDPETLEQTGQGITYAVPEAEDQQPGAWVLDAPAPEPTPGPAPSGDPYAPRFEHNLPWPEVLDERPAGPQSVRRPPPELAVQQSQTLPPPPLPPAQPGPQVLDMPDSLSEYDEESAASWTLPESSALAYAPPSVPAPQPQPAAGLTVVVDRQVRGTAPLRLAADGTPMLSVQSLEMLRLPVPATAVNRGFATPQDLEQSYAYAFDAAGQLLVLTSLAPPAIDAPLAPGAWAPLAAPSETPASAARTTPSQADCAPHMRRGRSNNNCS